MQSIKIKTIVVLLFTLLFSGCLSSYSVNPDQKLDNISYEKNSYIKTGKTTIFAYDNSDYDTFKSKLTRKNRKREGDFFYKKHDMLIYEDNQNIYFYIKKYSDYLGKYIESIYGLNKEIELNPYKTDNLTYIEDSDISCNNNDEICTILAKKAGYLIKMYQEDEKSGEITFEYIYYKPLIKRYQEAINNYDDSITKIIKPEKIEKFFSSYLLYQKIASATTKKQLQATKKIATYFGYDSLMQYLAEKELQIETEDTWKKFLKDYERALNSPKNTKESFIQKYANTKNKCIYKVSADRLNIRANKNIYSRVVGQYKKNDIVTALYHLDGWVKTPNGWVSSKYLQKQNCYNYLTKIDQVKQQVFAANREAILKSNSIEKVAAYYGKHKNDNKIKQHLIELYRKENTISSYRNAYKLSNAKSDLNKILLYSKTAPALEEFLATYKDSKYDDILHKAKKRLAILYREESSFDSFYKAYILTTNLQDLKNALKLAKSLEQKAKLEEIIFKNINNSSALIDVKLLSQKCTTNFHKNDGGMFVKYQMYGDLHIDVKVKVSWSENAPFKPQYGKYKATVHFTVVAPRYLQRRSNWLGNADTNSDAVLNKSFDFILSDTELQKTENIDLGTIRTTFFERGGAGGYTAKWLRDNVYIKVKSVDVTLYTLDIHKNRPFNINIDKTFSYNRDFRSNILYVTGSQEDSYKYIKQFDNIDRAYGSSGGSVKICIPSIPKPIDYSECNEAITSSGKYATVKLSRGGGMSSANCFELNIYGDGKIGVGNTCGGANGNWSVNINGESGFASGLGNAIEWLLKRM